MVDLTTRVGSLVLKNPLIAARQASTTAAILDADPLEDTLIVS